MSRAREARANPDDDIASDVVRAELRKIRTKRKQPAGGAIMTFDEQIRDHLFRVSRTVLG